MEEVHEPVRMSSMDITSDITADKGAYGVDDLVQRLSQGDHPVTVGGPQPSLAELKSRIEDLGYVFVKFTDTRGGTDLGVRVDTAATSARDADFDAGGGSVHIEGTLTLNYTRVRCIADIELSTLSGTGHLVVLEDAPA
jgi:hypothetical protein